MDNAHRYKNKISTYITLMTKIKIIRHSERLDYTNPLYWLVCIGQYWADSPLTNNGHKIADEKGKLIAENDFKPKNIYTSPYSRTMATATVLQKTFPDTTILIESLLAEFQPTWKHRINLYPDGIPTTYNGEPTNFSYPESYQNFSDRVLFIIGKLLEKNDEDILIVTHGEVLKAYTSHLQRTYPNQLIDPGNTPYLTTLSFEFDRTVNTIVESSIMIQ